MIHEDDPIDPHIYIEQWSGKIIRWDSAIDLSVKESYNLENNDIVETSSESIGIIHWPDKSITRLWANTRIVVEKMEVNSDYSKIQISYKIEKGKTWNNIIRLLVGESYFETRLPKNNIVAWVRWTVFEINLDNKYIHAVNHATHLTDAWGNSIDIFPWELVSSENILLKKWQEWIDTTWNDINTLSDASYEKLRALEIQKRFDILSKKGHSMISLDGMTGKILSYIQWFEFIRISQDISAQNYEKLATYSENILLEYYQKASGIASIERRDILRSTLIEKVKGNTDSLNLQSLLENISIWESLDSGKVLPSAKKLLKEKWSSLEQSFDVLSNTKEMQVLIQSLSGNIRSAMPPIPDIVPNR